MNDYLCSILNRQYRRCRRRRRCVRVKAHPLLLGHTHAHCLLRLLLLSLRLSATYIAIKVKRCVRIEFSYGLIAVE